MVSLYFIGLFWLLFAHCMADFAFQSGFIAEYKSKDLWVLVVHCIIYTGCVMFAAVFISPFISASTLILGVGIPIFLSHFIVDAWKVKARMQIGIDDEPVSDNEAFKEDQRIFHMDQVIHITILIVLDFFLVIFQ